MGRTQKLAEDVLPDELGAGDSAGFVSLFQALRQTQFLAEPALGEAVESLTVGRLRVAGSDGPLLVERLCHSQVVDQDAQDAEPNFQRRHVVECFGWREHIEPAEQIQQVPFVVQGVERHAGDDLLGDGLGVLRHMLDRRAELVDVRRGRTRQPRPERRTLIEVFEAVVAGNRGPRIVRFGRCRGHPAFAPRGVR